MDPRIERSARPQPAQETETAPPKPARPKSGDSGPKVSAGSRDLVRRHATSIFVLKPERLETAVKSTEVKSTEVKRPISSEDAIAEALRSQTKQEIRTRPPPIPRANASAPSRPSSTRAEARHEDDCASKAVNATTVCTGAVATAAAGTATGPADLVIVGVGGAACGLAYLDYYSCEKKSGR